MPGVTSFLTQRICQDLLEIFFGLQRQRNGVHKTPNVLEFFKHTQALRVINGTRVLVKRGNCHMDQDNSDFDKNAPLLKRKRVGKKQKIK